MKFREKLQEIDSDPLKADGVEMLQVNLGYRCNMVCKHCHVEASPARKEMMELSTVKAVIDVIKKSAIKTVDITGGAPEMNPHFSYFVRAVKETGRHVIVRSNLTIFYKDGMNGLPEFYRDNDVEVVASLPYYLEDDVDRIRGSGTFKKSMDALKTLNELGYGNNSGLHLNLVYNPQGAYLPSAQSSIESEYKRELKDNHDIEFNNLYTFTNMPIGRFKGFLEKSGNYEKYMTSLSSAFNHETLNGVMCRHLISIGWDGTLYDCDFNQVTGLHLLEVYPQTVIDFDVDILSNREIAVDDHCYGCTAGKGST